MVHVIATIRVKTGSLPEFLEHFKANVPNVLEEDGCIEYNPTIDTETDLEAQQCDEQAAVIVEKWRDLPALKAHLEAPHMLSFRERVKDLVEELRSRSSRMPEEDKDAFWISQNAELRLTATPVLYHCEPIWSWKADSLPDFAIWGNPGRLRPTKTERQVLHASSRILLPFRTRRGNRSRTGYGGPALLTRRKVPNIGYKFK